MASSDHDHVAINLDGRVLDGLNMHFEERRARMGQGQMPTHLQDEDVERGPLSIRLKGEWSAHARFCVYWRTAAKLSVFKTADDVRTRPPKSHRPRICTHLPLRVAHSICVSLWQSLLDKPEATLIVTVARTRGAPNELAVRTHDGETVTCVASSQADACRWLEAMSAAQASTIYG